jgi:hypothetical protein
MFGQEEVADARRQNHASFHTAAAWRTAGDQLARKR